MYLFTNVDPNELSLPDYLSIVEGTDVKGFRLSNPHAVIIAYVTRPANGSSSLWHTSSVADIRYAVRKHSESNWNEFLKLLERGIKS